MPRQYAPQKKGLTVPKTFVGNVAFSTFWCWASQDRLEDCQVVVLSVLEVLINFILRIAIYKWARLLGLPVDEDASHQGHQHEKLPVPPHKKRVYVVKLQLASRFRYRYRIYIQNECSVVPCPFSIAKFLSKYHFFLNIFTIMWGCKRSLPTLRLCVLGTYYFLPNRVQVQEVSRSQTLLPLPVFPSNKKSDPSFLKGHVWIRL